MQQNHERMAAFFDSRADTYDRHMREAVESCSDLYAAVAEAFPLESEPLDVLDLGIGTGLELEGIFVRAPDARITGIDLSARMLDRLSAKYRDRMAQISLRQESFLDADLGCGCFDVAVSVMALHHWLPDTKGDLYRRIRTALRPGGTFILADYIVSEAEHRVILSERAGVLEIGNVSSERMQHVDLPMTLEIERNLLVRAGYSEVRCSYERSAASVLVASR